MGPLLETNIRLLFISPFSFSVAPVSDAVIEHAPLYESQRAFFSDAPLFQVSAITRRVRSSGRLFGRIILNPGAWVRRKIASKKNWTLPGRIGPYQEKLDPIRENETLPAKMGPYQEKLDPVRENGTLSEKMKPF